MSCVRRLHIARVSDIEESEPDLTKVHNEAEIKKMHNDYIKQMGKKVPDSNDAKKGLSI